MTETETRTAREDVWAALLPHMEAVREMASDFIHSQPNDPAELHPSLASEYPMPSGNAIMESLLFEEAFRRREHATYAYEQIVWEHVAFAISSVMSEQDRGKSKYLAFGSALLQAHHPDEVLRSLKAKTDSLLSDIHDTLIA